VDLVDLVDRADRAAPVDRVPAVLVGPVETVLPLEPLPLRTAFLRWPSQSPSSASVKRPAVSR